ncbi:unnamed protein product [Staurois parvus]|uniref:Uncharacterized protein n=1 Tax=Staurois parvus TaxID=386267 RepID=A0ABN9DC00_9NEOB|nr:unnamed protein product [Staurois parvus]
MAPCLCPLPGSARSTTIRYPLCPLDTGTLIVVRDLCARSRSCDHGLANK